MGLFGNRVAAASSPPPAPRDVEALELLSANLENVTDEASTWRIWASTYAQFYGLDYVGVWLFDCGSPRLEYETGKLAGVIAPGPSTLVEEARRTGRPAYADKTAPGDSRLAAAIRGGARSGSAFPSTRNGRVAAVMESYIGGLLDFDAAQ